MGTLDKHLRTWIYGHSTYAKISTDASVKLAFPSQASLITA